MDNKAICPCGSHNLNVDEEDGEYQVCCMDCECYSNIGQSEEEAINSWNFAVYAVGHTHDNNARLVMA